MKKPAIILISATVVFVLLLTGFFIGRISKDGTFSVYTQKSLHNQTWNDNEERPKGLVNINTATTEELQDLPGIGPATADEIIAYRTENGPFKYKLDIMNVPGIGEKTYNQIRSMITVGEED